MKRILIIMIFLSPILYGCGEAGFQSDISKISEIEFDISSSVINGDTDNVLQGKELFNFGSEDFDEYAGDIQNFTIGKLSYEILDYNNTSGNLVLADLVLQIKEAGQSDYKDVLTIFGLIVENTGEVLAWEDGNPASALSQTQVAALKEIENSALNRTAVDFQVSLDFTDDVDSDMKVKFYFDLTARVQLD